MEQSSMTDDLRAHKRYVLKKNAFAALGRGINMVGRINDISKGGLSFEHISNLDPQEPNPEIVDIFLPGNEFYLAGIPCTKIYDIPIRSGSVFAPSLVSKRCGIKFNFLNDSQLDQLEHFIKVHAAE